MALPLHSPCQARNKTQPDDFEGIKIPIPISKIGFPNVSHLLAFGNPNKRPARPATASEPAKMRPFFQRRGLPASSRAPTFLFISPAP
jgi:hypothetical protein